MHLFTEHSTVAETQGAVGEWFGGSRSEGIHVLVGFTLRSVDPSWASRSAVVRLRRAPESCPVGGAESGCC